MFKQNALGSNASSGGEDILRTYPPDPGVIALAVPFAVPEGPDYPTILAFSMQKAMQGANSTVVSHFSLKSLGLIRRLPRHRERIIGARMRLDVARGVGPLAHSYPGQPYARVPLTPTSNPAETSPEIKLWWWGGGPHWACQLRSSAVVYGLWRRRRRARRWPHLHAIVV